MKLISIVLFLLLICGCAGTLRCGDCTIDDPCKVSGEEDQYIFCHPPEKLPASWHLLETQPDGTKHSKGITVVQ
jgi:hypothetical protein